MKVYNFSQLKNFILFLRLKMPHKKNKKNSSNSAHSEQKSRELIQCNTDTDYAFVTKVLGGGRFAATLNTDGKTVISKVRGKFKYKANKKNNFVEVGSLVLVSTRDFQDGVVDIIHVYNSEEVRQLRKLKVLNVSRKLTNLLKISFLINEFCL